VSSPAAFLLDLDGTLYTDAGPVAGGPETLASFRARGIPFRAVTNTTSRSRFGLVRRLAGFGFYGNRLPQGFLSEVSSVFSVFPSPGAR
jgi:ribonucleotide monophosphatase NagD (HAD superfamily)